MDCHSMVFSILHQCFRREPAALSQTRSVGVLAREQAAGQPSALGVRRLDG